MSRKPEELDYVPGEMSSFLATHKKTLSPKAFSTLRVMAFLDPRGIHTSLFEPLRRLFAAKNEELKFNFPTSPAAQKEACAELVNASLIHFSKDNKAYTLKHDIQTSVLADTHKAGLIPPLFNGIVKVLSGLWPQMVCIPDRTVDQREYEAATAPGTDYEAYLRKRYTKNRLPLFEEYTRYAERTVWGRRDELVHHVTRLEHMFYHADDDMVEVCATVTFAMLLAEASWYHFERSRYRAADAKIQSALGVYDLGQANSSLHHAAIYRLHAAIALENGKLDEATQYVNLQVEKLELHGTAQGVALRESGLLDGVPDAISSSSWFHDVPPGKFVVLPFRSVCNFAFKLYLSADDEKDRYYPLRLLQAEQCFSAALKDYENADIKTARMKLRIAELYYALGNVANKQASYLGKAHFYESLDCFEKALSYFQKATTDDTQTSAGIAKTHYKLAAQSIQIQDYESAMQFLANAEQFYAHNTAFKPHLARLIFQKSRIQKLIGDPGAKSSLLGAFALRAALRGGIKADDKPFEDELSEADFDELVGIWER